MCIMCIIWDVLTGRKRPGALPETEHAPSAPAVFADEAKEKRKHIGYEYFR